MAKKLHPLAKEFNKETENAFKRDKDNLHLYTCGDCHVEFVGLEEWKFSFDGGECWHFGKYPSGLNSIKINTQYTPKKGK